MILFPNQTITHPDDVHERVQEEFRKDGYETQLWNYVAEAWDCVDQASQDSFPASDPPPWTLGCVGPSATRLIDKRGVNQGVETVQNRTIILSDADHQRLEALVETARYDSSLHEDYLDALEGELKRARVVPQSDIPDEVITMNSVVRLRDLDTDEVDQFQLVYPADADMTHHRISVLAPVGTAILGYQLGNVIEWIVPAGLRRLRVEMVSYQPEMATASIH